MPNGGNSVLLLYWPDCAQDSIHLTFDAITLLKHCDDFDSSLSHAIIETSRRPILVASFVSSVKRAECNDTLAHFSPQLLVLVALRS